jgi:flagellar biosynthesis anti-sigma factor FlgM
MAIENINNRTQNSGVTKLPNNPRQAKSDETVTNKESDSIKITTAAQELKTAFESLISIPAVNSERVEAAKMAIANGNYAINAETIAAKLIQLEKTLPDDST